MSPSIWSALPKTWSNLRWVLFGKYLYFVLAVPLLLARILSHLKIEACLDVLNIDFVVPFREPHSGKLQKPPTRNPPIREIHPTPPSSSRVPSRTCQGPTTKICGTKVWNLKAVGHSFQKTYHVQWKSESVTNWPSNLLTRVGSWDAYGSKTTSEMHVAPQIWKAASKWCCSLELFEYCSICSDWITVVFWGNSLVKLIIADVSQCFPCNLNSFPTSCKGIFWKQFRIWGHNA